MIPDRYEELNQKIDALMHKNGVLSGMVAQMQNQIERLNHAVEILKDAQPFKLTDGHLPTEFDKVECQIFHTPLVDMTAAQRKAGKRPWSVKLQFYRGNQRVSCNIALHDSAQFKIATKTQTATVALKIANGMDDTMYAGMNRASTTGKGTPYTGDEVILIRHIDTAPYAAIQIGTKAITFPPFRPGKGKKKGHAIWYSLAPNP